MLKRKTTVGYGLCAGALLLGLSSSAWAQCGGSSNTAAAKQSAQEPQPAVAAAAADVSFAIKGLTEKNAAAVQEAFRKFAAKAELNTTVVVTPKPREPLLLSKLEKELESAGASLDHDRWVLAGPVRLHVAGMSCGGCAAAIKDALSKLEGVQGVTVDLREGYVRFTASSPTYRAVRKAVAGTPFRLVDVSLGAICCGNCDGGGGPCCGNCELAGAKTDSSKVSKGAQAGPCCGNCDDGGGPCCGSCTPAQKTGKMQPDNK